MAEIEPSSDMCHINKDLFSQLPRLRFTAMVTYSLHLYSRSSHIVFHSFHGLMNSINWSASMQCMGLHSSASRALQRERRGHGFKARWSPPKRFFRAIFAVAIHCDGDIFISFDMVDSVHRIQGGLISITIICAVQDRSHFLVSTSGWMKFYGGTN